MNILILIRGLTDTNSDTCSFKKEDASFYFCSIVCKNKRFYFTKIYVYVDNLDGYVGSGFPFSAIFS